MRIIWANSALLDLDAIRGYYVDEVCNPHAAMRVARAILKTGDALDVFPLRGRRLADGMHTFPVVAYPQYRLVYDVDEAAGVVEIVHVEATVTEAPRPAGGR